MFQRFQPQIPQSPWWYTPPWPTHLPIALLKGLLLLPASLGTTLYYTGPRSSFAIWSWHTRVTLKAFVCSFLQRVHPAAAAAPPAAQAPLAQLCLHLPGWYHDKTHLWQVMAVFRFSHFQRWGSSEQLVGAGWFWSSARGLQGRALVMAAKLDIMWHGFSREIPNWIDFLPEYGYGEADGILQEL